MMGGCFFTLAILFLVIGLVQLFSPHDTPRWRDTQRDAPPPWRKQPAQPIWREPGQSQPAQIWRDPQAAKPAPIWRDPEASPGEAAPARSPASRATPAGGKVNTNPQKLAGIQVGQRVNVRHPQRGDMLAHVMGRIAYTELWQTQRGPQAPWVPTGNNFLGFWLEGNLFLLNWQDRFYLLDEAVALTDADIQTHFQPFAREFAKSNQTAEVHFAYPPAMWKIVDIGKFRVEQTQGEGLRFQPGAIGRFIHASGDSQRALVVEDYEGGGGGQDTAWIGYQIQENDVTEAQ